MATPLRMKLIVCFTAICSYIFTCDGSGSPILQTQATRTVNGLSSSPLPHPNASTTTTVQVSDYSESEPTERPTLPSSSDTKATVVHHTTTVHSVSLIASRVTTETDRAVTTSSVPHKAAVVINNQPASTTLVKTATTIDSMSSTVMPTSTEGELEHHICETVSWSGPFVVGMATLLAVEILALFIWQYCWKRKPRRWIPSLTDSYHNLLETEQEA